MKLPPASLPGILFGQISPIKISRINVASAVLGELFRYRISVLYLICKTCGRWMILPLAYCTKFHFFIYSSGGESLLGDKTTTIASWVPWIKILIVLSLRKLVILRKTFDIGWWINSVQTSLFVLRIVKKRPPIGKNW